MKESLREKMVKKIVTPIFFRSKEQESKLLLFFWPKMVTPSEKIMVKQSWWRTTVHSIIIEDEYIQTSTCNNGRNTDFC